MEKIFVDTGGWVGLFVENDKFHKEAEAVYGEIEKRKSELYTSDYVIDETVTLIKGRSHAANAIKVGQALLKSELIKIIPVYQQYFHKSWVSFAGYHDKPYSFTDVTSFIIMKDLKIVTAFAFDEHFSMAGFKLFGL